MTRKKIKAKDPNSVPLKGNIEEQRLYITMKTIVITLVPIGLFIIYITTKLETAASDIRSIQKDMPTFVTEERVKNLILEQENNYLIQKADTAKLKH